MKKEYNKIILGELLKANPSLSNSDIAKLYNEKLNTTHENSNLRKAIRKIRNGLKIENPFSKNTNPKFTSDTALFTDLSKTGEKYHKKENSTEVYEDFTVCDGIVTTLDDALAFSKVDLTVWEVKEHTFNTWTTSGKFPNPKIEGGWEFRQINNVQVKIWFKKKDIEKANAWKSFVTEIDKYTPDYLKLAKTFEHVLSSERTRMLELSLPDLHIGKLAWEEESGENYKTKEAMKRYNMSVEKLLAEVNLTKIDKILLPIGNDMLNIDNKNSTTTAGTPQDSDSRWQKMFLKAKELLIYNIDRLSTIAPVEVLVVPGNHDNQTMFYLGDTLQSWYRENPVVSVRNEPTPRKYVQYGVNLIGFTHGNEEKHSDLGSIMATQEPQLWANTKYREFHLGHFHKSKSMTFVDVDEFQGCKVRVLPSLSGTDAWHNGKGYMSIKAAMAFVYDKKEGLVGVYQTNILK